MLSEEGRRRQLAELTVLIADDDKIILENIVRNIDWEAQGFKVVGTALNGAQALALFRELHPDLVVTDVLMPVLSGLDLIREIRAESPHTPVLLISSYEEFAYVRQALFMGAQGYVLKSEIFGAEFRERLARIRDGISQERTSRKAFERGLIERWFARNAGAVIGEEAWSAERESSLPRGKFRFALFGEWMPVRFSEAAEPEADMEVRRERMMNLLPERLKSGVTFFARDVLVVGLTPERWDERALGEYAGVLSRALHREPWRLFAREAMTLEQLCGCLSARVNALRYLRCFREGAPRALEALAPDPQDKGPRFPYPDLINVHADACGDRGKAAGLSRTDRGAARPRGAVHLRPPLWHADGDPRRSARHHRGLPLVFLHGGDARLRHQRLQDLPQARRPDAGARLHPAGARGAGIPGRELRRPGAARGKRRPGSGALAEPSAGAVQEGSGQDHQRIPDGQARDGGHPPAGDHADEGLRESPGRWAIRPRSISARYSCSARASARWITGAPTRNSAARKGRGP